MIDDLAFVINVFLTFAQNAQRIVALLAHELRGHIFLIEDGGTRYHHDLLAGVTRTREPGNAGEANAQHGIELDIASVTTDQHSTTHARTVRKGCVRKIEPVLYMAVKQIDS